MITRLARCIGAAPLLVAIAVTPLSAQSPAELNVAGRGTELGGHIGAAIASTDTAPVVTGMAGWRLTPWVTLEARGSWFVRGADANGLGADVGALVNIVSRRRVTPYLGAAFGLYRATMDVTRANMSHFYRLRAADPAGMMTTMRTFTDPAWRMSAGVDIVHHRNVSIRPEAAVILVHRDGATETITTIGLRLGYVFEDHPVTPSKR